nr:hypothetical protein BaRGS_018476 [Batillaria attramentaria]
MGLPIARISKAHKTGVDVHVDLVLSIPTHVHLAGNTSQVKRPTAVWSRSGVIKNTSGSLEKDKDDDTADFVM